MELQEIIKKITETEASISKELEKDNLELAQEYLNRSHELLKELVKIKDSLTDEDLNTAKEFASAYAEHIKEQVKILAVEQAKISDEFKKVRKQHQVSNKYAKIQKIPY